MVDFGQLDLVSISRYRYMGQYEDVGHLHLQRCILPIDGHARRGAVMVAMSDHRIPTDSDIASAPFHIGDIIYLWRAFTIFDSITKQFGVNVQ